MATASTGVTERSTREAVPQERGGRTTTESALPFPVDIYEDGEGITLAADMPGVSKDRLDVRIEGDSLLIEGQIQFNLPEQAQALYADVRSRLYRRSFALSRELQSDKIQANVKDGVLTVHIPKRAELRARKIEVQGS
ncbi:MAG: Hsp20/alpha crystallin family protein [Steroidobacteraceae bacterium]